MFKRISRQLALQFTGFVFLLFLVNGAIFLAVDFANARRDANFRLTREADLIAKRLPPEMAQAVIAIPPQMRERVRIIDSGGQIQYAGSALSGLDLPQENGMREVIIQNQKYDLFSSRLLLDGQAAGFIEVLEMEREPIDALPARALSYLLVSIAISALTYLVGLFFSRRSLKPAEEMLERLDRFTQDASHELRTPIAVMQSSLDVALKTKHYKEGIDSAKQDLKEISALVERLLELARLDAFALEKHPTDLSALAEMIAQKFTVLAEKKSVTIKTEITQNILLPADEGLIRQVLSNLLSNAIKFTPTGGTVTVRVTHDALQVSDTGVGISADHLPHIFDRFYRADASRTNTGYGLGLALVKRIVDLHRWTIDVASEENAGTTFTVKFPKA